MVKKPKISLLLAISFLIACGGNPATETADQAVTEEAIAIEPSVNEDDLIMRLSLDLFANPQKRAEQEQNAIVNYAIDEMLDIHRTPSGLYYQILESGQGDTLQWADRIRVH